jgi:L-alanine-DL-glutamate epimerase-like enolase superfamily enzyme
MKIVGIACFAVRLPLVTPFIISYGTYSHVESVLVRLTTDTGLVGWGEATPDPYVTGESWAGTEAMLRHDLLPLLRDQNPLAREAIHARLDGLVTGAPSAKAAIDLALWDIAGKQAGLSIAALLGGPVHDTLVWHATLSIGAPAAMAAEARAAVMAGHTEIKMKVGAARLMDDVERIMAVRAAVGPDVALMVDANQGWRDPATAIRAIQAIAPAAPVWIEQAIRADDFAGLAEVRRATGIAQMADEGVHSARDGLRIAELRAADLVNVKLMKTGGITEAMRLIAVCEAAGLRCMVGSMVESTIATAAGVQIALARRAVVANGLVGPVMLRDDLATGLIYADGAIRTDPDAPGLGIAVDEERVTRFAATTRERAEE